MRNLACCVFSITRRYKQNVIGTGAATSVYLATSPEVDGISGRCSHPPSPCSFFFVWSHVDDLFVKSCLPFNIVFSSFRYYDNCKEKKAAAAALDEKFQVTLQNCKLRTDFFLFSGRVLGEVSTAAFVLSVNSIQTHPITCTVLNARMLLKRPLFFHCQEKVLHQKTSNLPKYM